MQLKSKKVVLTGGSHGLGKEIVKMFLNEGASVSMCARNMADLEKAYDDLAPHRKEGQKLLIHQADVSKWHDVENFANYTVENLGGIDVLVNNAGVHGSKNAIDDPDFDMDGWMQAINVNLAGTLNMCRAAMPFLKNAGNGKIINLSGGGATSQMPGMSAYASSKAAIVRFTETIAIELKKQKIDVNAVAPGAMNTRLLDDVLDNAQGKITDEYYQRALKQKETGGTPLNKAAELCVYLASAKSNGITGKLISAVWDDWKNLHNHLEALDSDIYTLRRIVPEDRSIAL